MNLVVFSIYGYGVEGNGKYIFWYFTKILIFLIFLFFLWRQTKEGGGYAHIWEMGVSMALYGDAATTWVFEVTKTEHTLLLIWEKNVSM